MYKMKLYEPKTTESMLIGKYAHKMLESKRATIEFLEQNRDVMLKKKGDGVLKAYTDVEIAVEVVKQSEFYKKIEAAPDKEKEFEFLVDYKDIKIKGIIDAIVFDHENKTIDIYDYKTLSNFDDVWDEHLGGKVEWDETHTKQGALYVWALLQIVKNDPPKLYMLDYIVNFKVFGFRKKAPFNIQVTTYEAGHLSHVEGHNEVKTVLAELMNISKNVYNTRMDGYYCFSCPCCAENKIYRKRTKIL